MSLTLNILFFILDPPNITLQNKNYVRREKSVSLDCKVDGYPIPTITWTPCNAQEHVCDQSTLNISKVQNDGVYTCTAKNRLGNDSANTSLGKFFYFMCTSFLCTKSFCQIWDWHYFALPLMRKLLHNFVIVLWINEETDGFKPGVELLIVTNVFWALFVALHCLNFIWPKFSKLHFRRSGFHFFSLV